MESGGIIQVLLDGGADIDLADQFGITPLMFACFGNRLEAVQTLVERGTDRRRTNAKGRTAMDIAVQHQHREVTAYLRRVASIGHDQFRAGFRGAEKYRLRKLESLQEAQAAEQRAQRRLEQQQQQQQQESSATKEEEQKRHAEAGKGCARTGEASEARRTRRLRGERKRRRRQHQQRGEKDERSAKTAAAAAGAAAAATSPPPPPPTTTAAEEERRRRRRRRRRRSRRRRCGRCDSR